MMPYTVLFYIVAMLAFCFATLTVLSATFSAFGPSGIVCAWLSLTVFTVHYLRTRKKINSFFLGAPFFAPLLLFPHLNAPQIVLLFAACFFALYLTYRMLPNLSYYGALDAFRRTNYLLIGLLVLAVTAEKLPALNGVAGVYVLVYLAAHSLALRLLRSGHLGLQDRRSAQRLNIAFAVSFAAIMILAGLPAVQAHLSELAALAYRTAAEAVAPVIYFVLYGVGFIAAALVYILKWIFTQAGFRYTEFADRTSERFPIFPDQNSAVLNSAIVAAVLKAAVVILLAALIGGIIIKILLSRLSFDTENLEDYQEEKRFIFNLRPGTLFKNPFAKWNPSDGRSQIRNCYRKFMRLAARRGVDITAFDTTAEINRKAAHLFDTALLEHVRTIYAEIRYGDFPATKIKVNDIRNYYKKLISRKPKQ